MKRTKTINVIFAPGAWGLGGATRRAAMTLLVMMLTTMTAWAQEAIGAIQYNSSTGYYEINTTNKLKDLAVYVNGSGDYSTGGSETTNHECQNLKFRLTDDLDFGGGSEYTSNFTPIGARSKWFQGEFDGNGKTISGVRVYRSGKDQSTDSYIGIFGQTYDGANIHDLTVNDAIFTGYHYVGGIAGHFYGGSLTRCTVTSSVYVKGRNTYSYTHGGITGDNNGTLTNCVSSATLSNGGCQNCLYYGGIAGRNSHTITGCLAVGVDVPNVFGSDQYDDTYGAICGGYSSNNYSFSGNYYRDCKLNGTAQASGFGLKGADVSGQAEPGIIVSGIPTNVTVSPVALTIGGHDYYGANSVLTFSTGADNKVFSTFTATGGTASSLAADKKTATVTLGSSDVTLAISATFQTISGTTEDGLTWNLAQDADGNYTELTIDGTGPMQNYQYTTVDQLWRTDAPWGWQTLTKVTVGDGVTRIGEFAFIGAQNLASVTIGSGVTEIAKGAINHCDAMTTITLPAVTTVGSGAFENCMHLQTVYFGHDNAVTLDTSNAFNAPELQTINFPSLAGAAANYATTGNWSGYSDKLRPLSRLTIGEGVAVTSDVITEGGATYVHPGQTVTFSVSSGFVVPEGYTFSGTYIPEGGKATAATDQGSGSWSFTVPAANVTVSGLRSDGLSHSVTYMLADGSTDTHDAIALDETMTSLAAGWYFIGKDINYSQTVILNGSTTIILCDGCTMSIGEDADGKRINGKGINGNTNYALTIYGQSLDDATAGHLKVFTTGDINSYGIYYSPYTQHSGNVTVKATGDWAIYSYGDITVNGGTLSATSLTNEAVVADNGGDIIINGGKVNATSSKYSALWSMSGDVIINGGQVEATGNSYGINAVYGTITGTITLGWTNATDYIHASGYGGTVKIAAGKRLAYTDGDNVLHVLGGDSETTLTADEIAAIAGKTLRPMLTGSGTTDDLYLISNATDWDVFCDLLEENNQGIFTGKTVVLDNDIAVTRMAGSTNHEFSGIFDGQKHTLTVAITGTVQGTAPFCEIKGATIRNLAVTGSVAGKRHSAGLVGFARGDNSVTNTIENCLVNTSVSITGDTNGYLGGIVGHGFTSALTIRGCAFTGSLTSTSYYTGGLQGWSDGNILTLQNDLFAPTSVSAANAGFHPVAFHNNNSTTTATVSNVYYTVAPTCTQASRIATANAAEQPKQQRNITAGENVTVSNIALTGTETEYNVSGITAYSGGGLQRGETLYYGIDDNVSLTLSNTATGAPDGYQYGYTANAGTLEGSTLTMPDQDVTVSVNTDDLVAIDWATVSTGADKDNAYIIYNKDQLLLLAYRVNGTHGETCQTDGYSGKYFKLGKDIKYTHTTDWDDAECEQESNFEAIGGYYDGYFRSFCGHFDGNNNTISGIRIYKDGSSYADYYQGIFGQTYGADIHHLTLADARITGYDDTGGIVGNNYGTVTGCHVAADVAVCAVQSDARNHGGIAGNNFGTIEQCTSAATLTIADAGNNSSYGGIAGINRSTLRDNLAIGASVPAVSDNSYGAITGENDGGSLLRNYYAACKMADTENATGVGCGYISDGNGGYTTADVTANNGAVSIHTLTLADGITTTTAATVTIGTTGYYAQGTAIALSYSGTIGDGYQLGIVRNDGNGFTAAVADGDGHYTAVMPAANATATDHAPIDWATVSTGADKDNAYMIYNKDQLLLLAHRVNGTHGETANGYSGKYFQLGKDIKYTPSDDWDDFDSDESNFEAIGGYYNDTDRYFCGHFDGNNKTISGIRIHKDGNDRTDRYQGIFGRTDGADIHDLTLADARITGYNNTGGIVGYNDGSTVSGCHVAADVAVCAEQSDAFYHGGIVGDNYTGTIEHCTSAATLTTADASNSAYYGGIAGYNENGTLRDNLAIGATVPSAADNTYGAITGENDGGTLQRNYYTACKVADTENATGVGCGYIGNDDDGYITADVNNDNYPDGAVSIHTLTLADGITTTTAATVTIGTTGYYAQGTAIALSYSGTPGDAPQGYQYGYTVSAGTISGSTLTMPDQDVTVSFGLRSTHEAVEVSYVDADGNTQTAQAIALDGTEYYLGQNNQETWYFVGLPTVAFDHTLYLYGDVNLILADGCTMNVTGSYNDGIVVNDDGSLTIYGQTDGTGTLNATGGDNDSGIYTDSGTINISGGTVTATGGGGISTDSGTINISGGRVTATGSAGIYTNNGTITISGGRVTATGDNGYGIHSNSGDITISGGRVTATVTATATSEYNAGIYTYSGNITLGCTTASDFIYASSYFVGSGGRLNIAGGQTLYDEDDNSYSGTYYGFIILAGKTLRPLRNVLALYDSEDNSEAISDNNGQQRNVILYGRTLSKSGEWNTLCLPFDIDDFSGTPLEGATVKELNATTSNLDNGTLTLNFTDADVIEAGKPYIVRWGTPEDNPGGTIVDPVFSGVTVSSTTPTAVNFTGGSFVGQYSPFSITADNIDEIILLSTGNRLGYSQNPRTLRSFRAHFEIPTNGGTPGARAFVLNFDDENTTGIISPAEIKEITDCNATLSKRESAGAWYSLDGRKLDGKPTKKGVYIRNGKKIVIK